MSATKIAVGLMSGTSMDGIDAALLQTNGLDKIESLGHFFLPYEDSFKELLKDSLKDADKIKFREDRPGQLLTIERLLTLKHAECVKKLLDKLSFKPEKIDVIGFHGQTVLHKPEQALTVQLGDGALLAKECGIDVVYDMRANDMKHGGQGAPLVPVYHAALAKKLGSLIDLPAAFVNIGGISNLTFIQSNRPPVAFDCGPGNALLDQWMLLRSNKAYDENGEVASRGTINQQVLDGYLSHSFFTQTGATSLDWRDFPPLKDDELSFEDGAATLVKLTTKAIAIAIGHLPQTVRTIIVSGGGARNQSILNSLAYDLKEISPVVATAEALGLNGDFMEAEAWAYLAVRSLHKYPLTYPETTGCKEPVTGGVFVSYTSSVGN